MLKVFNFFRLSWDLFWDAKVSWWVKMFVLSLPIGYLFFPSPDDFVPLFGLLDDFAFLGLCLFIFNALCPIDRRNYHRSVIEGRNAETAVLDQYRHPKEIQHLATGFAIIFGLIALGGGFVGLIGLGLFVGGYFYSLFFRGQMLGNAIRVTEQQYPELHIAFVKACQDLPSDNINLFLTQDPMMNAYAIGYEAPYSIVLTSGLVERLNLPEIQAVIGHEAGHILMGHTRLNHLMGNSGGGVLALFFWRWSRTCEYSADHVALLASQLQPEPYISAMVKMTSGLVNRPVNVQQFMNQDMDSTPVNKLAEKFSTHPFTINRIRRVVTLVRASQSAAQPTFAL